MSAPIPRFSAIFCCFLAALHAGAAAAEDAVPPARPRIGLVLSGGGARGLAHVGVLQALEELHIPVDAIAGTSMGAVVGGLYASGKTPARDRHAHARHRLERRIPRPAGARHAQLPPQAGRPRVPRAIPARHPERQLSRAARTDPGPAAHADAAPRDARRSPRSTISTSCRRRFAPWRQTSRPASASCSSAAT